MSEVTPVRDELVVLYDGMISIFGALYLEMKELGKKKPDATLSKMKVTHINRVLEDAKSVVEGEPEAKYLDLLDSETLPQYSDAIVVMAQFDGALKAFRRRHYGRLPGHSPMDGHHWYLASYDEEDDEEGEGADGEGPEDDVDERTETSGEKG